MQPAQLVLVVACLIHPDGLLSGSPTLSSGDEWACLARAVRSSGVSGCSGERARSQAVVPVGSDGDDLKLHPAPPGRWAAGCSPAAHSARAQELRPCWQRRFDRKGNPPKLPDSSDFQLEFCTAAREPFLHFAQF